MGKKQVRQVRQQMRRVQPKAAAAPTPGQTRKQRERYVQAGGMLQGYAPDFVINAGGVINISEELGRPYDPDRARRSVERIAETLTAVFARSRSDGIAPHAAADRLAEERIAAARATRPDPIAALYRPA